MAQAKREEGGAKSPRSASSKRERGMKQLRIWVVDPRAEGFRDKALGEAARLAGAPEETEALDFIGAAFEWPRP